MCLFTFYVTWSQSSGRGRRLRNLVFAVSVLYGTAWSFSRHENVLFSFWCITCWYMGQSGCNVIPLEWCSSHLGSSFELLAQRLSQRQRERIVRHWFTVKKKKKLGQNIISVTLGKIKSSAGRERVQREMVSLDSHFIHRRVWNGFICCVDTH